MEKLSEKSKNDTTGVSTKFNLLLANDKINRLVESKIVLDSIRVGLVRNTTRTATPTIILTFIGDPTKSTFNIEWLISVIVVHAAISSR